ncbi:glycoside hydrolase family 2 TIM barrel-domain containing protein [Dysgonomonas sp. BGC7]|uniref:glycosyl hydrolase 2 galactose-binding domain-containing protein n=1 Tax=Dysgonomonas sp. BGC7 TaxID=1658008 RepID=UPI0006822620|nr:glycoside hydrolase family 2 TIM barrel-domain containing protein [Dysgonomonas sp. BGC7]MBD8390326.1 glycoside hydrolase family 2 [Dysgonomonas sp. BGC7]
MKNLLFILLFIITIFSSAQNVHKERHYNHTLTSTDGHNGKFVWKMKKANELNVRSEDISTDKIDDSDWMPAVVPGTVLNSLVYNKKYPEPYYGINNKLESELIPDLFHSGRDFYTYWFRTEFNLDREQFKNKKVWLQVDGINYRAEVWLNGSMVGNIAGMFQQRQIDISDKVVFDKENILSVKVYPIDVPGTIKPKGGKSFGATGEFQNGGNGEIGKNVTQLMTVGWDFTFLDGIRDRNTGIWKDISIFATGRTKLNHPFVKSELSKPGYNSSRQTISVEVAYPNYLQQNRRQKVKVIGEIKSEGILFEKEISLFREEVQEVIFTPEEFPQLVINNPRLWWPVNKGSQELYDLVFKTEINGEITDSISTRFGIREITSSTNTPDKSRTFYINGKPIFIRGTNWLPENMLRTSDERTYAELKYSAQSGINLIRFWGGGITESDYFFQLCDELGILVWQEFWMTGDTKHPVDRDMYLSNLTSTVKRIRNHPSLAYYVSSNESSEMPHAKELINKLDGTRGYQMESECDGIHDGSPYKQVNIMTHYENTASDRGSRVDGFNPEYGAPCLPTVECLREMMDEKDLWPINKEVWDYSDGNGFHLMSTMYTDMTNEYGISNSIDEFAEKAQFVGALNYKSIWEVWNYNKLHYGDRYTSGVLYWYHNSPIRQVCGRMWDWSLEPTAALYAAQNACEPLHPQFDYLKNTVSVVNDYYKSFNNYKVTADVYDLNMKKIFTKEAIVNLPEDGVINDVFNIDFSSATTSIQFIKLRLFDNKNKQVGSNFYWRSNNKYEGRKTITGPATAGFQDIKDLAKAKINVKYTTSVENGKHIINLDLKNTSKSLSFFTQVQWLDYEGKPIRPSFYTNNFLCLLPSEGEHIKIETDIKKLTKSEYKLIIRGFNIEKQEFKVKIK